MRAKRYYHGTHPDFIAPIISGGFDINARRRSDTGDFGWGVYVWPRRSQAKVYGVPLAIDVNTDRLAYIPNPYFAKRGEVFQPITEAERLFHSLAFDGRDMRTTLGNGRIEASKRIASAFCLAGYTGIRTDNYGETVIFDLTAILRVEVPVAF